MNKTLFKANLKANWGLVVFFSLFVFIYVSVSITMFDPEGADMVDAMLSMIPEGMLKAFGFDKLGGELTSYLSSYLYGFIMLIFPTIYAVIVSNNLIAKHVDRGSMAYLLTTPNTRVKIATTQAIYVVTSTALIFIFNVGIGIIMAESMFKGHLDIGKFISLNIVTYLTIITVSSLAFLFSCIFNEARLSLSLSSGISIVFIVFRMISGISENIEWVKYLSIYSLVNIDEILANNSYSLTVSLILLVISVAIYSLAINIFNRKSLAI